MLIFMVKENNILKENLVCIYVGKLIISGFFLCFSKIFNITSFLTLFKYTCYDIYPDTILCALVYFVVYLEY